MGIGPAAIQRIQDFHHARQVMSPSKQQILTDVNRIASEVLENDSIKLSYETTANDVKEWDSLNHIQLVVAVEKHFKIRFNFAELQKFKNVGDMCDNIAAKLTPGGAKT
jgi:acyl carrier protein